MDAIREVCEKYARLDAIMENCADVPVGPAPEPSPAQPSRHGPKAARTPTGQAAGVSRGLLLEVVGWRATL